jgi:C2 domain
MPSSVRVRVVEARDLPEMDHNLVKSESFTDAYVDVRFRHHENRTQVRATLYPVVLSFNLLANTLRAIYIYSHAADPAQDAEPCMG